MKHDAVTVADDQRRLIDGAIAAGQFSSRSEALREMLREYFTLDVDRTAAIVATSDAVEYQTTVSVLDLDTGAFADRVRELNPDAAPAMANTHPEDDEPSEMERIVSAFDNEFDDEGR